MRYVLATVVALVAGIVLGGIRPRAEARQLETKIARLEKRECPSMLGGELVRALQRPPDTPEQPGKPVEPQPEKDEDDEPDDLEEGRTVLAARRAQARAALLETAQPSPEQLEDFDAAVADMNADLRALGQDLVVRVRELGDAPPRSELYRYAADGFEVILETEARIQEALGPQVEQADAEALDPLSHVDPSLVDVLIELDQAGFDP